MTYPAKSAPRFKKGFIFTVAAFVAQFAITGLIVWLQKREKKQKREKVDEMEVQQVDPSRTASF